MSKRGKERSEHRKETKKEKNGMSKKRVEERDERS